MTINNEHIYYSHQELNTRSYPQFIINKENILIKVIFDQSNEFDTTELTPRDVLIQSLKYSPKVIPVIDENKKVLTCITNNLTQKLDKNFYIIAKTPAKISFAGGGSDFTDYLIDGNEGLVLNCAINIFSTCTIKTLKKNELIISTGKKSKTISIDDLPESSLEDKDFGLILSVLKLISPNYGINISIATDFPEGSGLGGSSAVTISILTALNELQEKKWSREEIAYLAFLSERIIFNITGGWQDQYTSSIGGLNEIHMSKEGHHLKTVTNSKSILDRLQDHLIITNTGISRNSGEILRDQRKSISNNKLLLESLNKSKELVPKMVQNILNSRFDKFSDNLKVSGELKKNISSGNSSERIKDVYNYAIQSGVKSGRLLGAGSGGHFLFYVDPIDKKEILNKLNKKGYKSLQVKINTTGTSAKKVIV